LLTYNGEQVELKRLMATIMGSGHKVRYRKDDLRIGGIFSLTGYLSWSGKHKRKAADLKVEMINEAGGVGGRPLRLITYDDQSRADQAARIAEELVFNHRVAALVGTGTLPISKAVAKVANRFRTPAFINSGYAIDPAGDLFVFNTAHRTEFAISCAFQYFLERGIDRLALFMPQGLLGDLGSWLGRRLADRMGIHIAGEERFDTLRSADTFSLERLRCLKPGAIFSFSTGQPAASVAQTMSAIGFDVPLLVSHGNANPHFLKLLSKNPVPIIVPTGRTSVIDSISQNDPSLGIVTDFNIRHIRKYGEPANDYSAELADAIDLFAEGVRLSGNGDSERLRDAIEDIHSFNGMRGSYHLSPIDHYGTGIEQIVLLTSKDGRWHFTKTFSSVDLLDGFYGTAKSRLVKMVADLLPENSPVSHDDSESVSNALLAARTGLNCTDLGTDLFFATKLFCQQKQEMVKAIHERDFNRAKATLSRLLTVTVLQQFETPETFRLAVLELFHALFDAAIHEGAPIEIMVRERHSLLGQWEEIIDLEQLCLWIVKATESIRKGLTGKLSKADSIRENVCRYVEDHIAEELTVESIAREVGLSASHLMHLMRSSHNTSVGECITKTRIEAAKRLLRCSDMTLSAVTLSVGYHDQAYFTRVFKKQTGETPQKYRKKTSSIFVQ
jgi:branched-chain amino acid transport system substrate-binding protein